MQAFLKSNLKVLCHAILIITSIVFLFLKTFWQGTGGRREIQSNLHYKETWGEEFLGKVAMADTLSALLESILACK